VTEELKFVVHLKYSSSQR